MADSENDEIHSYVINETAWRTLGSQNFGDTTISINGKEGQVIGIVDDFHFKSIHNSIEPLFLLKNNGKSYQCFNIKIAHQDVFETISKLKSAWNEVVPYQEFQYKLLKDEIDELYSNELQFLKASNSFTLIAILISCLGLVGTVAHTSTSKMKEIGVRRAFGATHLNILWLVSKKLIGILLLSILISTPVSFYFIHNWLIDFYYRIDFNILWVFQASAVTTFLAFLVSGRIVVQVLNSNPVEVLRTE